MAHKFLPDDQCNYPTMSEIAHLGFRFTTAKVMKDRTERCGHIFCVTPLRDKNPEGQLHLRETTQVSCPFFITKKERLREMKALKARIKDEGLILSDTVLKVDSFLNHQVDTGLALSIGQEFKAIFGHKPITKVLTIEASGIQFAMATAIALGVPFIYAKKKKVITLAEKVYTAPVHSFTRGEHYQISVSQKYLSAEDNVLIVDDFLATGAALVGLVNIVRESGAELAGVGCVIEKSFQEGRGLLEDMGVAVHSLARIASMSPGEVNFIEEPHTIDWIEESVVGC